MSQDTLRVEDLSIRYETGDEHDVHAVTDASFSIRPGEYFGLVGESGCGKSTIAKAIIGGLDDNGTITGGRITYNGTPIHDLSEKELNAEIRWKEVSMIPQASMNSLDPVLKLSDQALQLARTHTDWGERKALEKFRKLFDIVGLSEDRIHDYPHQFSGGMQQRAIIALSLFLEPNLIIADEPTTALDVIMQDQIFKYLNEIRAETDVSMLLITHDISVVFENCDGMAVMHGGQVAEEGSVESVYDRPKHPYSYLLQRAFPDVREPERELSVIEGQPPQLTSPVDQCTFAERCPWATDACRERAPPTERVGEDHTAACIRHDEIDELQYSEVITND